MGDYWCYIVTLSDGDTLLRCAVKANDYYEFAMEPVARQKINNLLPEHVRSFGKIVEIDTIFEIHDATT